MSRHSELHTFSQLCDARGDIWKMRGYHIETSETGQYSLKGDLTQFYMDAVSRDADAHLGLELLRLSGSSDWSELCDLANDDGIDLHESQEVFLMGKPISHHVATLQ